MSLLIFLFVFLNLGIYTRVNAYIDWIENVTNKKELTSIKDIFGMSKALMNSQVDYRQISLIIIFIEIYFLI